MEEQTIVPEVLLDKAIELGLSFSDSAFPIGIFPSQIRNIIAEVHECQGFPIDYIASAMLVAIAVGIGNTHLVQLKRGWQESAMLYVALVGRPGTNKSHPLSFAMKPFLDFDYQENKLYEQAYTEYDNVVRMSHKERIEAGHSEQPTEPRRRRFIVSDITPEGLSFIHGSRTSIATTAVLRNSFGFLYSALRQPLVIAKGIEVPSLSSVPLSLL